MMTANFIQVIIRGLILGQEWQVSPCYTALDLDGQVVTIEDRFEQPELIAWFDRYWNGDANIGVANGVADELITALPNYVTVNEVRVLARNGSQALPVQLIYAANLTGGRQADGFKTPSFVAASLYATADDYGQRGASMRLPLLTEGDVDGNFIVPSVLGGWRLAGGLLETLTENAQLAGLNMRDGSTGEMQNCNSVRPAVVKRVYPAGPVTSDTRKIFPYEGPTIPQVFSCTQWQVHDYAGTQNSRKLGRGN